MREDLLPMRSVFAVSGKDLLFLFTQAQLGPSMVACQSQTGGQH